MSEQEVETEVIVRRLEKVMGVNIGISGFYLDMPKFLHKQNENAGYNMYSIKKLKVLLAL